jgi:hypothetical protein
LGLLKRHQKEQQQHPKKEPRQNRQKSTLRRLFHTKAMNLRQLLETYLLSKQ